MADGNTSGYSPTRTSILTERYPRRVGITDHISPMGFNQPEKWHSPGSRAALKSAEYATFHAAFAIQAEVRQVNFDETSVAKRVR